MVLFLLNSPLNDPNLKWVFVGLAGATMLYAVFRPSMRKKDPLARRPSASSLAQQRNVERQMQNLLVELSEMARQITAQLDTRSQKLEALMRQADEKITELRQASATHAAGSVEHQQDAWKIAPEAPANFEPDPRHKEIYALADRGQPALEIARQLNRPRGEVELILALRGRGTGASTVSDDSRQG